VTGRDALLANDVLTRGVALAPPTRATGDPSYVGRDRVPLEPSTVPASSLDNPSAAAATALP
jgi:hypothetical protein